jgi:hypothetical protein
MSSQNIPLKGRTDFRERSRILASRLSCGVAETQLGPRARIPVGIAGVGHSLQELLGFCAVQRLTQR